MNPTQTRVDWHPAPPPARPAPTSVGPPELFHAVPHQDDARKLREGLDDVEVAQGAHLEEGHAVLLGVRPRLLGGDLTFEGQMEAVTDQDPRHTWSMLGKRTHSTVEAVFDSGRTSS